MTTAETPPRGVTAAEFFALELADGTMADAHRGTGISYQTIHAHVRHAQTIHAHRAKRLQAWSLELAAARAAGVYISAARTLGLTEPGAATGTDG